MRPSLAAAGLVLLLAPWTPTVTTASAATVPSDTAGCTAAPDTSTNGGSFSATETLCRIYSDPTTGTSSVVSVNNFHLAVSDTTDLRNGQVVTVSWSGAHPTGAIISDEQLAAAAQQEFPVVIMECRGTDSPQTPVAQRLSPETCWTASTAERIIVPPSGVHPVTPIWSLDSDNPASEQAGPGSTSTFTSQVNVPSPFPSSCSSFPSYGSQYWLPFVAADGTSYPIGPSGCAGAPPEMLTTQENPTIVPSDTTYAETAKDGTGVAKFVIQTSEVNAALGCSQTVACSLVVVPIEGISCNQDYVYSTDDPEYNCENAGDFPEGSLNLGGNPTPPAAATTGTYWFSASNWQRHIAVPLSFTTPADACVGSGGSPIEFYGSEVLAQATQQWNPHFCLDSKLFDVEQVQIPEPQAKNSLKQGFIEAAMQGAPPPVPAGQKAFFTTPTVQAPVGVSGFAISYVIDNADGTPYTSLQLDPRLLAKLLTESYFGTNNIQSGDTGIAKNPQSIVDDPEFQALNPGYSAPSMLQQAPAATLFNILTQSDVTWSLTSYINADPEARAWLDGKPDPWGMVVNPAYKGIQLPVEAWPLLDTSTNGPDYDPTYNPFCVGALGSGKAKEPDRPLIDNPQDTLANVAYNLQYSIAASLVECNDDPITPQYVELGPEQILNRFLIGITTIPQADQLDLQTAALQTFGNQESQTSDPATFRSGRQFVAPSSDSLVAAAKLLQPNAALGSWTLPYSGFATDTNAQSAYPGTMLLSADVPSTGLPAGDASDYGQYLSYVATTGQQPGAGVGQLPAGYVPLTADNGLASEVSYTQAAAADVTAQNGSVPALVPTTAVTTPAPGAPTSTTTSPAKAVANTFSGPSSFQPYTGGAAAGSEDLPAATAAGGAAATPTAHPAAARPNSLEPAAAVGRTTGVGAGLGGMVLPLAVLVALVGGAASASSFRKRRVHGS